MKKLYITPSVEVLKIELNGVLCVSSPKVDGTTEITNNNMDDFSQHSNSFRGGVIWEED